MIKRLPSYHQQRRAHILALPSTLLSSTSLQHPGVELDALDSEPGLVSLLFRGRAISTNAQHRTRKIRITGDYSFVLPHCSVLTLR